MRVFFNLVGAAAREGIDCLRLGKQAVGIVFCLDVLQPQPVRPKVATLPNEARGCLGDLIVYVELGWGVFFVGVQNAAAAGGKGGKCGNRAHMAAISKVLRQQRAASTNNLSHNHRHPQT